jgi:hypothetical protein
MRLAKHINRDGSINTTLTVLHGAEREVELTLPAWDTGWNLLWNSSDETPATNNQTAAAGSKFVAGATSILVFNATA